MGRGWFLNCDNTSLDISCSETKASKNPTISLIPAFLLQEIVDDLEAALEQFREIAADLASTPQLEAFLW